MYRPVVAGQGTQIMPTTLLQHSNSRAPASTTYTIMASPQESSPQTQASTAHPLTTTSLIHTSSPHILTSVTSSHSTPSPSLSSSSSTPTVVNGLVHLKPVEMKKIVSPETKRPPMDISCLTREGVVRSKTPPALLQMQSNKKPEQPDAQSQQSKQEEQEAKEHSSGEPVEPTPRQDVVLVQAAPSSSVQRLVVIGEKEKVTQPQPMVLPVAYDQQLVSMPIYRVGSSLGGLQPVQVLASLPSGGPAT